MMSRPGYVTAALAALVVLAACGGGGDGITVTNTAAALRFVGPPTTVNVGQPFSVTVEIVSSDGQRAASATHAVTLSLAGGTISGTTTVSAVAGVATFTGLSIGTAGATRQLTASASGLTPVTTTLAVVDACAPLPFTFPGSITGSVTTSSCTDGDGLIAVYRFTATGTGPTVFSVTGLPSAELAVTNDPPGEWLYYAGSAPQGVWLLPARSFQVRVTSRNNQPGSFTLTGSTTPTQTGCNLVTTLLPFAALTYTSSISSADCLRNDNSYYERYLVHHSSKPCTITMRSSVVNAFLSIRNGGTGAPITFDDNSGGGTDARVTLTPCSAGGDPIEIWANTLSPNEFGSYTLTVEVTGGESAPR
jgi:hypothetical protein